MIALGTLLFSLGLGALVYGLARTRAEVATRPDAVIVPTEEAESVGGEPSIVYRALEPLLSFGGAIVQRVSPAGRIDLIRRRIVYAGMDGQLTAERVMGYKAGAAVVFFLFGLNGAPGQIPPLLWALLFGALASFAPDLWLDSRARERQTKVSRDLPEALDLLAISVEAGLGLEQAIEIVTENLRGPLGEEFTRMLREIELGVSRRAALNELRYRTDVNELSAFVVALLQADQVGAPIADVLRVQAEQVRLKRRQRAREKAAQTPVKILFPLIFFIFPSIFVVTVGPGAINIIDNLLGNL